MKLAAILTVYNDEDFLGHFLGYYSRQVDRIFAIDNGSDDRSIEILKACPIVEISTYDTNGKFNFDRKHEVLQAKRKECSGKFDFVLILDVDEFVVPKKGGSIREVVEAHPDRIVFGTAGYNMFTYDWDPPYDPGKPLIEQRQWGLPSEYYSKPILIRPESPLEYGLGCHYLVGVKYPYYDTREEALFFLLHYRGFDEKIYLKRCLMKRDRNETHYAKSYYAYGTEEDFLARLRYEKNSAPPVKVI